MLPEAVTSRPWHGPYRIVSFDHPNVSVVKVSPRIPQSKYICHDFSVAHWTFLLATIGTGLRGEALDGHPSGLTSY